MILNTCLSHNLLIDAYKFYKRGDARAHDAIRIIIDRNDMQTAVIGCLEQAEKEEEPEKQHIYVQAACFGKMFHPGIAIDEYQLTCKSLRVRNICNSENLEPESSIENVIEHLVSRRKFPLALWIVNWLEAEEEKAKVYTRWSEYMIEKRHLRDDEVATKIIHTLGPEPIVGYADIADKAAANNRINLAIKLIEHERQSSRHIDLLLEMRQYNLVLTQAVATRDSNIIYTAIFKLRESVLGEQQFFQLLKRNREALKYYCQYLAHTDTEKLILISHAELGPGEELAVYLAEQRLESSLAVARRLKREFVCQQLETSLRLAKFQASLKQSGPPPRAASQTASWLGLSVSETIMNLVASNQASKARDCQKKFEVSEKKFRTLEQLAMNVLPRLAIQAAD